MVDHHSDRNWAPLDEEVPHTSGAGATAYIVAALILLALAAFWLWSDSTISLRTYSDTDGTPVPMDNPVEPLRSPS